MNRKKTQHIALVSLLDKGDTWYKTIQYRPPSLPELRAAAGKEIAMSFPKQILRNAEELSVSFLSAQTSSVLSNALRKLELSRSEKHTLDDAAVFLEQIADGAQIANTATVRSGSSPSLSIAAFDIALGPIATLKNIVRQDEELDAFFGNLASAVRGLGQAGHVGAEADEGRIKVAQTFFESLRSWLANELSCNRPKIGDRAARFA
jgi:hypothetical protein